MVCPLCGSAGRRAISPNYWECEGRTSRQIPVYNTGPGNFPTIITEWSDCGHRYHDGSAPVDTTKVCACGVFAIGVCSTCGASVCGDDSSKENGRLVCTRHIRERDAEAAAARRTAESEAQARDAAEQSRLRKLLEGSRGPAELIEAIKGLDPASPVPDRQVQNAWQIIAPTLRPQFEAIALGPARGPFAAHRAPVALSQPVPVYAWGSSQSRDLGYGETTSNHFVAGVTADGRHLSGGAFRCERAPWNGLYLARRGDGIRRRAGAAGLAILAIQVRSRPADLADYRALLYSGLQPAHSILSEIKGDLYADEGLT